MGFVSEQQAAGAGSRRSADRAGIEDPHNPASNGRLLLVTHNCNLDFDDSVAITGVDPHRETDEVIEVATSSSEGELKEHLVLAADKFDREHIFRAALENGASMAEYRGQGLLVVERLPVKSRKSMPLAGWLFWMTAQPSSGLRSLFGKHWINI